MIARVALVISKLVVYAHTSDSATTRISQSAFRGRVSTIM
jgi:hypothetical protein